MRALIEDCRRNLLVYLSPDSGISDREMVIALLNRLEGAQARDALGEEFGWSPRSDKTRAAEGVHPRPNEGRLRIILNQARRCP